MSTEENIQKYLDGQAKLLDPRSRDLEPADGDLSCVEMCVRKIDTAARTVEAIVSTADVDRYQEIVEPKAYKKWLKHFMANPVMLAAHDHSAWSTGDPTTIGRWKDIQVTDKGLLATCEFMPDDELAEKYWRRYRDGYMKAFSVGFIAHAWEMRDFEMAGGVTKRLRVFTEVELLEISAVAVPANRQALARAAGFGGSDKGTPDADAMQKQLTQLLGDALKAHDDQLIEKLSDPDGPVARMVEDTLQRAADREGMDGYFSERGFPGEPGEKTGGNSGGGGDSGGGDEAFKRELRELVGG